MAAKGKALLVGLKRVNPNSYSGWNGQNGCSGCELDVDNMETRITSYNVCYTKLLRDQPHGRRLERQRKARHHLFGVDASGIPEGIKSDHDAQYRTEQSHIGGIRADSRNGGEVVGEVQFKQLPVLIIVQIDTAVKHQTLDT